MDLKEPWCQGNQFHSNADLKVRKGYQQGMGIGLEFGMDFKNRIGE
jgi:hypothetical protein